MKQSFFILFLIIFIYCNTNYKSYSLKKNKNYTLLFNACKKGNYSVVEDLINQGIDINHKEKIDEISDGTPLILVSMIGNEDVAELLIKNGADVNIKNIILYITLIGLFIFIVMVIILFYKLHAHKTYRENIVKCEARIISEILNGDETNLECIRRRYRDCFKK